MAISSSSATFTAAATAATNPASSTSSMTHHDHHQQQRLLTKMLLNNKPSDDILQKLFFLNQRLHASPHSRDRILQEDVAATCAETPFIWKIHHTESSQLVGFGIGTMHLPTELVVSSGGWTSIENVIYDVCSVYAELDITNSDIMQEATDCSIAISSMGATIMDIPNEQLRNLYVTKINEIVDELFEGLDAAKTQLLNTDLASIQSLIQVYNTPELLEIGYLFDTNPSSLDGDILNYGGYSDKFIGGLETVETQCNILDELNPTKEELLEDFDTYWSIVLFQGLSASHSPLIQRYKCGDLTSIENLISPPTGGSATTTTDSELYTSLFDDRNVGIVNEMIQIIENEQQAGGLSLFAVGLGHWTIGPKSMEILLKENGYTIERIESDYDADEIPDSMVSESCNNSNSGSVGSDNASGSDGMNDEPPPDDGNNGDDNDGSNSSANNDEEDGVAVTSAWTSATTTTLLLSVVASIISPLL